MWRGFALLVVLALSHASSIRRNENHLSAIDDEDFFYEPREIPQQPPNVKERHPSVDIDDYAEDLEAAPLTDESFSEPEELTWGGSDFVEEALTSGQEKLEEDLLPMNSRKWATFFLGAFFLIIAAGGGIGGGGILVPLYAIVLGFELHHAVPLSNMTICASALTNLAFNIRARHPTADRPLIDWDLILVMEPLTIAGALVGSLLNVMLPGWIVTIMLVILLFYTGYRSIIKGKSKYRAECAAIEKKKTDSSASVETGNPQGESSSCCAAKNTDKVEDPMTGAVDTEKFSSDEKERRSQLQQLLVRESKFPWFKFGSLLLIFSVVLFLEVARGGHGANPLGVPCGSAGYWVITFAVIPFCMLCLYLTRMYLLRDYHTKVELEYEYQNGDVVWNERATIVYPAICCLAGLFAGLFGIGGGIVKGPLMLEMNVRADVAAATSATMILFTSFAAGISFSLYGAVAWQYVMVMAPIAIVATAIGQTLINRLIAKFGHPSYIIFCISAVVLLSASFMGVFGILSWTNPSHKMVHSLTIMEKLCGVGTGTH